MSIELSYMQTLVPTYKTLHRESRFGNGIHKGSGHKANEGGWKVGQVLTNKDSNT